MRGKLVQAINIPDDCIAIKVGQTIEIRKKVVPKAAKYHCRDCKHLITGYTNFTTRNTTDVCGFKPKPLPKKALKVIKKNPLANRMLYFTCSIWSKICEHFKLKENEDKHKQV